MEFAAFYVLYKSTFHNPKGKTKVNT